MGLGRSQKFLSFYTYHYTPTCRVSRVSTNDACQTKPKEKDGYLHVLAYIMIKPDGVQRGLVGKIIQRFEDRGYQLVAMKLVHAGEDHLEKHYKDLKGKPFFPGLIKYMSSGPVVAMVWQGKDVVKQGRALLGATNPLASAPGTIRGDYCIDVGRNICHGSDSPESAKAEIALWFGEQDATIPYKRAVDQWIYE